MKKLFYLPLMLGAIAVAFTSCNGDDDEPTSATLLITSTMPQSEAPGINRVLAATFADADNTLHTVAYAPFTSLGFSLLLDATPDASSLERVGSDEVFTISNPEARIALIQDLLGFRSTTGAFVADDHAGWFFRMGYVETETEFSMTFEVFVYADRPLSMTGTESGDGWYETMSVNLVQGWNRVFETFGARVEGDEMIEFDIITTTPVSGLTWFFDPSDDDIPVPPAMRVSSQENSVAARVMERVAERRNDRR